MEKTKENKSEYERVEKLRAKRTVISLAEMRVGYVRKTINRGMAALLVVSKIKLHLRLCFNWCRFVELMTECSRTKLNKQRKDREMFLQESKKLDLFEIKHTKISKL